MRHGSWSLLTFHSKGDQRGQLVALQEGFEIPFEIKRVYYLTRTLAGVTRGMHAHIDLDQVLIAVSGKCRVLVDNGVTRESFILDDCQKGLRITNLVWREMSDFSSDCVLLVLANRYYEPLDYVREYSDFLRLSTANSNSVG